MNILTVAFKLIRQNIKTLNYWVVLLLFPLLIILILGFALSGVGNNEFEVDINLGIYSRNSNNLEQGIGLLSIQGLSVKAFTSEESADKSYSSGDLDVLVLIDEDEQNIQLRSGNIEHRGIVESLITNVQTQLSLYRMHPELAGQISRDDWALVRSINKGRSPRAIDYYAVTMLTMFIMYGAYFSAYGVIDERTKGTLKRILTAPIRAGEFLGGVALGTFLTSMLQILVIVLCANFVFGVYYGDDYLLFGGVLLSLSFFTLSLGLWLASVIKSSKIVDTGIHVFILLAVFLAGGFMSLPDEGIIGIASRFSPVYWVNKALFTIIYGGDLSGTAASIIALLGVSLLLLVHGSYMFLKKEAV